MQALAQAGLTPVATLDRTEALARWALQLSGADGSWAPAMAELVALQAVALGPPEGPGPLASQRAFARALADSPVALATAGRALIDALDRLGNLRGLSCVALEKQDIVRHPLVQNIVTAYGE